MKRAYVLAASYIGYTIVPMSCIPICSSILNGAKKALNDAPSLIPHYRGWAVHDCWASYFRYNQCRHAICGAHLLRDLHVF